MELPVAPFPSSCPSVTSRCCSCAELQRHARVLSVVVWLDLDLCSPRIKADSNRIMQTLRLCRQVQTHGRRPHRGQGAAQRPTTASYSLDRCRRSFCSTVSRASAAAARSAAPVPGRSGSASRPQRSRSYSVVYTHARLHDADGVILS
jgi:hypothetical protein